MKKKYFGTDGIRGTAYEFPMNSDFLYNLARAIKSNDKCISRVLIGMDTRETSQEIKQLIIRGIHAADEDSTIVDLGLVTTPELHHETYRHTYPRTAPYLTAYFSQIPELEYPHVVVDCANGVGSLRMRDIVDNHNLQNNILLAKTTMYYPFEESINSNITSLNSDTPNYIK